MSASQDGSQVLGLPGWLPSSAFFSAMGVAGTGLVCGWGCCGGAVLVGCGVERLQAVSAIAARRRARRRIVAFRVAGAGTSVNSDAWV